MIKLLNVSKKFGTKDVINEVSLEINRGEIYGLIGLSGAGKSTLLRMINGLEAVSNGHIEYHEQIKFGFVFQSFNLVNSLSCFENVKLALTNSSLDEVKQKQKVNDVLELVGLSEHSSSYPKSLSGGQKQRVGIARALVNDVDVLLCDEATSALDPFTANEIIGLLNDLNEKLGLTIIFVSHQLEIVKDFCDKIAIIDQGSLCEVGTTLDVFSKPQSEIAIKLLGNILGFSEFIENPKAKVATCFEQKSVRGCLETVFKQDIKLLATYQHQTKQGMFAHVFVETEDEVEGVDFRRINGL